MSSNKTSFWSPLKTDSFSLVFWSSLALPHIIKIYQGDRTFFEATFGESYADPERLKWMKWTWHNWSTLVLFGLIPAALIKTKFKQSLTDYGLGLGDWRFGLTVIGITTLLSPFLVYQSAQSPEHVAFYQREFPLLITSNSPQLFLAWCLTLLPHYIGYEFFYRGYILLGLEKRIGTFGAIMLQTTFTILMHIGKPMGETWGAAIGGILMGLLVIRTRSIWYVVIFHWLLGVFNAYFCAP